MAIPKELDKHLDHVDAAVFTGDLFTYDEDAIAELESYINSWRQQLYSNKMSILNEKVKARNANSNQ